MSAKIKKRVQVDDRLYDVCDVKRGGMGRVWLLENPFDRDFDPIHKNRIAVKTFDFTPKHFAIEQELDAWVTLEHNHIVPLLKIGKLDFKLAAIMPWLSKTLAEEVAEKDVLDEEEVISLARQIVEALRYAYDKFQLVHLDLKPENLLIQYINPLQIQLSDWGISRFYTKIIRKDWRDDGSCEQFTAYGAGTPLFMAPERFSKQWQISPQADMYSLGMVLIHLLTGLLPFQRNPYEEIMRGTYVENAKDLLKIKSHRLQQVILDCINPDPSGRPKTYKDLISRLKRC